MDEKGTEAAAAIGIISQLQKIVADHPFLFLIRDNLTGSILFLGRLVKTSEDYPETAVGVKKLKARDFVELLTYCTMHADSNRLPGQQASIDRHAPCCTRTGYGGPGVAAPKPHQRPISSLRPQQPIKTFSSLPPQQPIKTLLSPQQPIKTLAGIAS
ncbi:hypothetical protein NP493_103g06015 [Ridgeia piscesae]|uniref:Serpin domain-containing protein n=1 Tax=Ridgeia piscesae TaxID=27915 RepID=A0AAD9P7E7_RIDPI|nr:hypothetical protein NP493_103g06015 [Ridgeia piscesae]